MVIHLNELNCEEVDTQELFETGNSSNCNVVVADLLRKNRILNEEFKGLKREHSQ